MGKVLKSHGSSQATTPDNAVFVVDGGYFLRTVVWPKPALYQDVFDTYKCYLMRNYGLSATVVFDGYSSGPSTKGAEQMRRARKSTSIDIEVAPGLPTTSSQSEFLGNQHNKVQLIKALSTILE